MEIFKLFGTILVDSSKAEDSISKTEKKAEGLGNKLKGGIATAAKWGAGIVGAAGIVGGAMLGVATKTADAMGEIDDMAQRAGVSAEEFQKYAYAAKLSGMETATLEKAMIKQQKAFTDAKEGSKGMSEAYKRLGIDIEKVGTSGEAFDLVIKKLADMEDETTRNALANDIFGKSYAELAPMLNQGSDGIEKLKREAVDLGGVMSNESVAAGAEFGDMLDKTKTTLHGVFMQLGMKLLPVLNQVLGWVMENMPEIQSTITRLFNIISKLFGYIEPIMPVVGAAVKLGFDVIITAAEGAIWVFDKLTGGIKTALEWLGIWNKEPVKDKKPNPPEDDVDGSHANGLPYVPYDGYIAKLHKGERVLTAQENRRGTTVNHTGVIRVEGVNNQGELQSVVDIVIDRLQMEARMA